MLRNAIYQLVAGLIGFCLTAAMFYALLPTDPLIAVLVGLVGGMLGADLVADLQAERAAQNRR